jgi:hypothetical protein
MDNRFIDKPILNSPPYGFPLVIANDDANSELNRLPLKLATGGGQTTVEICHLRPHVFIINSPMKEDFSQEFLEVHRNNHL